MKFHVAVVQCNGQLTDQQQHTSAQVRRTAVGRRLVAGFDLMLQEQFPQLADGVVSACLPLFDDGRGLLAWRLPHLFSAMAAFLIGGKLKFSWFFFSGGEPAADAIAVRATEGCLADLTAAAGLTNPRILLQPLRERPLAVCVPWPPSASDLEQRVVGTYAACLADVFFAKVAEVNARGPAPWAGHHERVFRWPDN